MAIGRQPRDNIRARRGDIEIEPTAESIKNALWGIPFLVVGSCLTVRVVAKKSSDDFAAHLTRCCQRQQPTFGWLVCCEIGVEKLLANLSDVQCAGCDMVVFDPEVGEGR